MKTPRKLLFERHEEAGPKLDAIRREVVARHCKPAGGPGRVSVMIRLWQELVLPCRRIWVGLAAVWVLLFVVNISQSDRPSAGRAVSPPLAQVVIPFYTQEKLVNEMFVDRGQPKEAVRPPKFEPQPRSETSAVMAL